MSDLTHQLYRMLLRVISIEGDKVKFCVPGADWSEQVGDLRWDENIVRDDLYVDEDGTRHVSFLIPLADIPFEVTAETEYMMAKMNWHAPTIEDVRFTEFEYIAPITDEEIARLGF